MTKTQMIGSTVCLGVFVAFIILAFILSVLEGRQLRRSEEARRRKLLEAEARRAARKPSPSPVVPPQDWQQTLSLSTSPAAHPTSDEVGAASPPTGSAVMPSPVPAATPTAPPLPDLAGFAPMSDDQIQATAQGLSAQGVNLFQTFRFGLRSQIPPVSDPRTALIDRALVAHGLLTPEELQEIHRVGNAMDEAKPDEGLAIHKAQQQVRQTLQARQRIKEQKKAEAAERRRQHALAVAQRKATDILFLGRGVSKGLADRQSDIEKLTAAGLPVLSTPADVAAALGLEMPRLRWLAYHSDASPRSHYVRFVVPKRSGGTRALFAPHERMAAAQEWILRNVLDKLPLHEAAHGFVRGRSTVTNATPHVDRDVVVNADLENFFPTITFRRVLGIFRQLGYSPAVATVFALLCTECPRRVVAYAGKPFHVATGPRALPQGACTSPALSNLAARRMDSRLTGIARKLVWTYTRYADDLTFSKAGDVEGIGYLLARVRHIAQDEGFVVNEKKTRVLKRAARQEVTGVVVNKRPGVPRKLYKRMRAILHRAKHEGLAAQNREGRPNFEAWVEGMIAYVSMVNAKQGRELSEALARVR